MPTDSVPELASIDVARLLLAALQNHGVRDVVICPGSRSAPLAYALAEAEAAGTIRLHVRIDERGAGFTALGLSLASSAPVPVVTTSGTAVGELLPSVMEANHVGARLLVLSADRPTELHGTGANQTTNQVDLFGAHVRGSVTIPAGANPESLLAAALASARGSETVAPGPVQINVAFRDPLVPAPGDKLPDFAANVSHPPVAITANLDHGWRNHAPAAEHRTVVVAGHGAGAEAEDFARALGLPLFAEPSSNARFGPNAIGPYRTLLAKHLARIERVVLFGRPTLSRPVGLLLGNPEIASALWSPAPAPWFEAGRRREQPIADPAELVEFAGFPPAGWLGHWQQLGRQAEKSIRESIDATGGLNGPLVASVVWELSRGNLVLGSSNVIRDADLCGSPAEGAAAVVYANRGLAGIDGTVATATGIALARGSRKTTLLVGDVTFLHDVGGLLIGEGEPEPEMDVVILNDSGGAIFSTLEHGAVEESGRYANAVERLFATPHRVRIQPLAAAYGWEYLSVDTVEELRDVLQSPGIRRIIEVAVPRAGLRTMHAGIAARINELDWPETH
ncbi:2-succinyl-5-enolpyruvyl-6-hydroxy-3-cyclohexene-1-carboxylic-acid synthase [Paeniglutamicibacter sulfureus]|uniref:2-succinyl-5-enolpyruvyl-6-hydroxy-3-cyclohexene-1-carboxylate synthase n=1 Tax=Paeniglutamicibacter sulfureus TaxID=43666 RepID=A0ABU2BM74_9MICC|nr:2-succinyl-5-enolpyruvyl-6-hydroxy-3-cyclohexene-1-carboxylic-acid synthase [Paeniglutamicibacter sulfureus]MDO2935410.1 2-succinyl-5-enolpyruvyl-6-hydroxy-3-cyclohexene-1-carboxylic-acid synthase [Paeniglutamicibacter sulfureus]MDR7359747.1 2-succinyl-5-enolpyruvyl-6-hydroxy-3-cyclohexene-1-carboxylate synthase [Paeniglutamicibacter sulfureus]